MDLEKEQFCIESCAWFFEVLWGLVQAPIKSGTVDPYKRVADHGRENILGRTLFVFTVYDSYIHEDKLKFGARSSEEAAKWMEAFKEAAEQVSFAEYFINLLVRIHEVIQDSGSNLHLPWVALISPK